MRATTIAYVYTHSTTFNHKRKPLRGIAFTASPFHNVPKGIHINMHIKRIIKKANIFIALVLTTLCIGIATPAAALAAPHACGAGSDTYVPSIELGCKGKGNPIMDLLFAIIRFLSYGVGLVIVGSLTYAGIQYTGSRGDPNANAQAVKRIQANVVALLLFVFAYAILNYLVPGTLLS